MHSLFHQFNHRMLGRSSLAVDFTAIGSVDTVGVLSVTELSVTWMVITNQELTPTTPTPSSTRHHRPFVR